MCCCKSREANYMPLNCAQKTQGSADDASQLPGLEKGAKTPVLINRAIPSKFLRCIRPVVPLQYYHDHHSIYRFPI